MPKSLNHYWYQWRDRGYSHSFLSVAKLNDFTLHIMIIHIIKTPNLKVTLHSIISPMRQASINNPISITFKKIWFSSLRRIMPGLNKRVQNITLLPSHAINDADSTINMAFISYIQWFSFIVVCFMTCKFPLTLQVSYLKYHMVTES